MKPDLTSADWKRLWCWERLGAGGEGDDRGWDGWMASRTQWTLSLSELRAMVMDREAWCAAIHGVTRVRHNWATELKTESLFCTAETQHCKSTIFQFLKSLCYPWPLLLAHLSIQSISHVPPPHSRSVPFSVSLGPSVQAPSISCLDRHAALLSAS